MTLLFFYGKFYYFTILFMKVLSFLFIFFCYIFQTHAFNLLQTPTSEQKGQFTSYQDTLYSNYYNPNGYCWSTQRYNQISINGISIWTYLKENSWWSLRWGCYSNTYTAEAYYYGQVFWSNKDLRVIKFNKFSYYYLIHPTTLKFSSVPYSNSLPYFLSDDKLYVINKSSLTVLQYDINQINVKFIYKKSLPLPSWYVDSSLWANATYVKWLGWYYKSWNFIHHIDETFTNVNVVEWYNNTLSLWTFSTLFSTDSLLFSSSTGATLAYKKWTSLQKYDFFPTLSQINRISYFSSPYIYFSAIDGKYYSWNLNCKTPGFTKCTYNNIDKINYCTDSVWNKSPNKEICENNLIVKLPFSYGDVSNNNSAPYVAQNIPSGETLIFDTNLYLLQQQNEWVTSNIIHEEASIGDPVNLANWEFVYDNTLMQFPWKWIPFSFDIIYKNKSYYNGPIWNNFDFSYNQFLVEWDDGIIYYHDGKLGSYAFQKDSSWNYKKHIWLKAELKKVWEEYTLNINKKDILVFGANKKIKEKKDIFWNTIFFSYDSNNQLLQIQDTLGKSYNFSYFPHSRIKNVTASNGNLIEFTYFSSWSTDGSEFDLKEVLLKSGEKTKKIGFTYTKWATFEDSHNIVDLIDSENNTYVTNAYENDRVISQAYGNGTIYYNYTLSWSKIIENKVTDREGNIVIYSYDEKGNTLKKRVKKSTWDSIYTYEYDAEGYITEEVLPLWNGYIYKYDENHNLIEKRLKSDVNTSDSWSDIVTKYTYNLDFNVPTQIINPNSSVINFTLDENGKVIEKEVLWVKDIDGNTQEIIEKYVYNTAWELIKVTNANGNETTFKYENGNVISKQEGAIITLYLYDEIWNITSITDGNGNITRKSYDDFNLLSSLTSPEWIITEYTHNNLGKKVNEKIILWNSETKEKSYEYDILDNPVKISQDIGALKKKVTIIKYDKNGNITEIKDGNNATVLFTYNEAGFITEKKILGEITSYIYDENNRLIEQISPNRSEIHLEYDLFDRVTKEILPDQTYTKYFYDTEGNVLESKVYSRENELLQKTSSTYDRIGRKTSETKYQLETNAELTEKIYYDALWNIIKKVAPNEAETNYTYDIQSRLIEVRDSLGNKILQSYDKNGNVTEKKIVGNSWKTITTSYVYDKDNRLVKEIDALWNVISYTYNKLGQITTKKDKDGWVTNYTYNYLENVLSESHEGKTIYYEYDISGNNTKITDKVNCETRESTLGCANGNVTNYEYDSINRIVSQIYPDGSVLTNEYDSIWNLIKRVDPNGTIVANSYDSLSRLIQRDITPWNEVLWVTRELYTYDSLWRLVWWNDSEGNEVSFNYDSLSRLISETNVGKEVNYAYDKMWNITSLNNTNYIYDQANRLQTVTIWWENIANYTYDSLSLTRQKLWNGVWTDYGYDELQRLKNINYSLDITDFTYNYNKQGNITSNGAETYTYDALDRITQSNYSREEKNRNIEESFTYDTMGNRQRLEKSEVKDNKGKGWKQNIYTQEYLSNTLNQYTEVTASEEHWKNKVKTYLYDKNGNLKQDGTFKYFYDYKNRLVQVENNPHTSPLPQGTLSWESSIHLVSEGEGIEKSKFVAEYTYDILGRRIKKETSETTTTYIYAWNNAIEETITEKESGVITKKENIYSNSLDDILLTLVINPEETVEKIYYTKNHLWSTIAITDETGTILEEYAYDVFWKVYVRNGKSDNYREVKDTRTIRLYTGREYDEETGLNYLRARYYNPELGRFISRDPIDTWDDINLYTYVGNNPVMYVDRMGKAKKFVYYYDMYRDLKEKLNNSAYFSTLSSTDQMLVKLKYEYSESMAKAIHYNRNAYNTDIPDSPKNAESSNWDKLLWIQSIFHQNTAPFYNPNDKYVSSDGHKEVIYDSDWNIVIDNLDIWTYNFFNPLTESDNHTIYDVYPYLEWWN